MLDAEHKAELERQQYRIVGKHSAVKICGWTKKHIQGEGTCYKHKFYGINSSKCMQMTSSLSCANRCIYCWRGYKAPVSTEWKWNIDDPEFIVEESLKAQYKLLTGFGGSETADKQVYKDSHNVKHVALSLTGEAISYPKINELLEEFHKRKITTFLVTNAQYPEQLRKLVPITQLYISLDSPTKEMYKNIGVPLFKDYWERLNESLEIMSKRTDRTCIRLTCIKGVNMVHADQYAELIKKADPDFIEVKAYMFLGESRKRLEQENMPEHEDIVKFSKELATHLPDYEIKDEHVPSRVVLLVKKGENPTINFQ
ncbi:4-demethylwyosine synthase TYW1 [Candidatus Woesearchaeota archaeon]|nr:4-demethylwyosine synthase TYW1 [Candidatus Woesearchaeota archaeon]